MVDSGLDEYHNRYYKEAVKSKRLIRLLKQLGANVTDRRGKGSHKLVELNGRKTTVPMGKSGELKTGTYRGILSQLGLTETQLLGEGEVTEEDEGQ